MSKFLLDESTVNQFVTAKGYPELNNSQTAVMKTLLRNQGVENERMMNESTMSADIASFTPILVPVIRRAYPALIGTEIAGTQALKTPTGLLYALTTNYTGNGQNPINPNAKSFLIEVKGNHTGDFTLDTAVTFRALIRFLEWLSLRRLPPTWHILSDMRLWHAVRYRMRYRNPTPLQIHVV